MPLYSNEPNMVPAILAQNQAGQGLVEAFTKLGDEFKRLNQSAKAADTFMQANPELLQQIGLTPEQWKAGGSRDKVAALTGLLQSQGYQKGKQDLLTQQAHQQLFTEQLKDLQQQRESADAEGEGARRYFAGPQGFTLDNASAGVGTSPAPDVSGIGSLLRANGYTPPTLAPGTVPGSMPMQAPIQAPNAGYDQAGPGSAAPGSLTDALRPYVPTNDQRLAYAFQTPKLGGRGVPGLIRALAELQKVQQEGDTTMRAPVTQALPGGYYSYGFPGTHQRGVYPDVTAAPRVFDTSAGQFVQGARGQMIEPRLPNVAAQEQSDVSALHQAEANIQALDSQIRGWGLQDKTHREDPKKEPEAPDPARLRELKQRRALQMSIINRAGQALAAPAAPTGGTGGARSAGAARLPASQDQLVKGQLYQTGRGPAIWDGTKFVAQ